MDFIKRYIILIVFCISFTGCIKEPIYPIPEVKFTIDWSGISAVGHSKGLLDSAYVYLYPQFDYNAQPIVIKALCGNLTCSAMPGTYRIIMHNAPINVLSKSRTDSYNDFSFDLPQNASKEVVSSDKLHILAANDPMHTITIRANGENVFGLKPITATKNLRFNVRTANFGSIASATGRISGVISHMNASTWTLSQQEISSVKLGQFSIEQDSTLMGGSVDVLGVNEQVVGMPDDERIVLTLYIQKKDSSHPIEQKIDLTEDLQDLEGDEIEVKLIIELGPEVKVEAEIKQWTAGGELDCDITTHPDEVLFRGIKGRRGQNGRFALEL